MAETIQMKSDPRFEKISELFINYSQGNFDHKIELTDELDEIDAFISSINMLGEELKITTISKNHFNNIFNSVSDMLFVLDEKGLIQKVNKCALNTLGESDSNWADVFIDDLIALCDGNSFFQLVRKDLNHSGRSVETESTLSLSGIPVQCTSTFLYNEVNEKIGYLINVKDISDIKKYENSLKRSEEKYRKIFKESSDCIFIIDKNGNFADINQAGLRIFGYSSSELEQISYFNFFSNTSDKNRFIQQLKGSENVVDFGARLLSKENNLIDCLISANKITDEKDNIVGYQGIIKDITQQKETENLVIRTIVDTQEKERIRFAKDIHDSLGQQLSAIKFYLATLAHSGEQFENNALLSKSNEALTTVLADMRSICFNLMPKTLENFGLIKAINELCRKNEFSGLLNFQITSDENFPVLNKSLEIAVFRIVQEFINNAIKHGKAKNIDMFFFYKKGNIKIVLEDNGVGFDTKNIYISGGMGFKNIFSRVQSYNGEIKIMSSVNNGTKYEIAIPIKRMNFNSITQRKRAVKTN